MKEISGQAAAELILIFGGIIIIVMMGLIFYKNYLKDLAKNIQDNELNEFSRQLENLGKYFN